jgi:tRNA(Ile)-lysidine synthase
MQTPLEHHVLETIRHSRMLAPGDRVAVAVSGGVDSVALLRLLQSLRPQLGITLLVAHFDHSLRAAESQADADFVASLAETSRLEFASAREDVAAAAARHRWNLEDAARRLRYAFFTRLVEEGRATRVAVAHTTDDQAETVLARILRGTGPTGLAGIYPVAGTVIRPLLGVRRAALRHYLRDRGDTWREDSSNRDTRRQRARIREKLLPLLEQEFSSTIVERLADLARLAREEESFWTASVNERFGAIVRMGVGAEAHRLAAAGASSPTQTLTIPISALLRPLPALSSEDSRTLTERLIRRLYEELRGDRRQLTSRHVAQVIRLAAGSSGRRIELPHAVTVDRNFDELVFSQQRPPLASHQSTSRSPKVFQPETAPLKKAYQYTVELSLPSPGASASVSVAELASRFSLKVIDWPLSPRDTKTCGEALDADLLRAPLILRNWRPGDSYRPRGRRQPRKLKQMFLAGRIPSRERSAWPVLESAGSVVWARGLPPAADFCVGRNTRLGLLIEEIQFDAGSPPMKEGRT